MLKSKFETVKFKQNFFSYIADRNISEIIDHYAKDGYQFKGTVPVKVSSYGVVREMLLVFEKTFD